MAAHIEVEQEDGRLLPYQLELYILTTQVLMYLIAKADANQFWGVPTLHHG